MMTNRAFLHIPKTAGQSITKSIKVPSTGKTLSLHIPSSLLVKPCKLFTIVRHPYRRLYSMFSYIGAEDFDLFLDALENPVPFKVKEKRFTSPRLKEKAEEAKKRWDAQEYNDEFGNFQYSLDKLSVEWFTNKKPIEGLQTFDINYRIPGHLVANQWDYIDNSVDHDIEIIKFRDWDKLKPYLNKKLEHINRSSNTRKERKITLTPERKARIRKICHKDFANLNFE